ncbi:hypothetical protein TWF730_005878 [Orbilia blumenaviensis]|uniref:Capsid protein n=1 Tax=Orbilia blumenaviensis TaxID=1796055 RepID=A0AAV9VJP0_9PEZI
MPYTYQFVQFPRAYYSTDQAKPLWTNCARIRRICDPTAALPYPVAFATLSVQYTRDFSPSTSRGGHSSAATSWIQKATPADIQQEVQVFRTTFNINWDATSGTLVEPVPNSNDNVISRDPTDTYDPDNPPVNVLPQVAVPQIALLNMAATRFPTDLKLKSLMEYKGKNSTLDMLAALVHRCLVVANIPAEFAGTVLGQPDDEYQYVTDGIPNSKPNLFIGARICASIVSNFQGAALDWYNSKVT